jgi:electron transfer flavoprotein alpha subunit
MADDVMNYSVVVNGCAGASLAKLGELHGFLQRNKLRLEDGHTILLYRDEADRDALLAQTATATVSLARLSRGAPEAVLAALEELTAGRPVELTLFYDDRAGRELAVRLGCRLGAGTLTAVRALKTEGPGLRCRRTIYAGHVEADYLLPRDPFCLSVARGGAGAALSPTPAGPRIVQALDRREPEPANWTETPATPASPASLEGADFILAAGCGAGSAERTARISALADTIGATFAASRPVVMNAWAPLDCLIGVSGVIAAPELCIVAGVSGSAAFMAGIAKSRRIVAVNLDAEAPIMRCCDVGVVGDCVAVLEALARRMAGEGKSDG